MTLAHTIVAMVGAMPAQVKCNTCGGFHKFRPPRGPDGKPTGKRAATSSRRSPASTKNVSPIASPEEAAVRWRALVSPLVPSNAEEVDTYDVRATYTQGDLLNHKRYGIGMVTTRVDTGRIRVLFAASERPLVHNYGKTAS